MNERINQLAEQATTIVDTVNSQGYSSSYANFDREKFAELIIKECANFVSNDRHNDDYGVFVANRIKQHFGFEK